MRKSLHTTTHHAISKPSTSHKSSTSVIGSIPLFPLLPLSNDRYRLSDIASLPSTTKTPLTTSTASTSSSEFPGPKSVPTLLAENKSLQAEIERLKSELAKCYKGYTYYRTEAKRLRAQVTRPKVNAGLDLYTSSTGITTPVFGSDLDQYGSLVNSDSEAALLAELLSDDY